MIGLPQASTMASKVDALFDFVLWTSVISLVLIVFGKLVFIIRFHRRRVPEEKTTYITGHTATEVSVAVILTIWVMFIFYWGWTDFKKLRVAPANALEITIIGQQWSWNMIYSNGKKLTNELVVPKGQPVKLIMTSKDVLHSFYVPSFRVKQDVIPNAYTSLWFEANQVGEFPVFCAEYCGTAHSSMLAKVRVLEPKDFEAWELGYASEKEKEEEKKGDESTEGKKLFTSLGCQACHSVDGTKLVGPTLASIFGEKVELASGETVLIDENYIRESIMKPNEKVVKGFQPVMPTFRGQIQEEDLNALMTYLKSLKKE